MLLLQRGGQRRTGAHGVADAFDDAPRLRAFGQVQQDAEGAVERLAGAEERGQLLGELQHLLVAELLAAQQAGPALARPAGIAAAGVDRQVALFLELEHHVFGAGGLHVAFQGFARGGQRLVAEQRHRLRLPG